MPQASKELRAIMEQRFGDAIGDGGPHKFLSEHGWKLNRNWTWSKDGFNNRNLDAIPQDEWECIVFLIEEWDFGGVS